LQILTGLCQICQTINKAYHMKGTGILYFSLLITKGHISKQTVLEYVKSSFLLLNYLLRNKINDQSKYDLHEKNVCLPSINRF
jgi:predicted DNA-binding protein (MmcQ/YjbR family)